MTDLATEAATDTPDRGLSRRAFLGTTAAVAAGSTVALTAGSAQAASPAAAPALATGSVSPGGAIPSAAAVTAAAAGRRTVDYEVVEQLALMRSGALKPSDLLQAYLTRIDAFNGTFETYGDNGGYNVFVRLDRANAVAAAAAADNEYAAAIAAGTTPRALLGIPMGIKDSVAVKGLSTQDGSAAFVGNTALADATVVAKLRAAGAVIVGQTVCSAFSGSTSGTFAGNAWNKAYIPGGSSQGSGVGPIARLVSACIGEETGGSIMIPSACNGASGIKPSLGLSSVAGLMPLSPGYDVLGPICRSMRDAAYILNIIQGDDPANDPITLVAPEPRPLLPTTARLGPSPLSGITIGIPQTDWMSRQTPVASPTSSTPSPQSTYDADHLAAFNQLVSDLTSLGATVKTFPGLNIANTDQNPYFNRNDVVLGVVDGTNITPSAAVINPNRYEIRYADAVKVFAADKSATVMAALVANYGRKGPNDAAASFDSATLLNGGVTTAMRTEGERRRRLLEQNYQAALDSFDVDFMLVFTEGSQIGLRVGAPGTTGLLNSRTYYQVPNALAWPMVSFPVGYDTTVGLPISAQFWGPRFTEPTLVQAALDYQANFPGPNHAAPADPGAVSATGRQTPAVTAKGSHEGPTADELNPLFSNDPLVYESGSK